MTMDAETLWAVAKACREAVNRELYGGDAPHDSNALTEVWPTRAGAGFTLESHGQTYGVVIAPVDALSDDLIRPEWP